MSTVSIYIPGPENLTVEMDSTTTGKYAAKRVANVLGYDDSLPWRIYIHHEKGHIYIDDEEIMAPYDGYVLYRLQQI